MEVDDGREHAFPGLSALATLGSFPGLTSRKVEYLRRLGSEAGAGRLDTKYLRSMPVEEALEELKRLPGVGPFSAELILLRGAGVPDLLPVNEPRLGRAVKNWSDWPGAGGLTGRG